MSEVLVSALSTLAGLLVGSLAGYAYAYLSGLKAVRKGMQLILREVLDEMYICFTHNPPTAAQKRKFEEIFCVYEKLADNGVMNAKHEAILRMEEAE